MIYNMALIIVFDLYYVVEEPVKINLTEAELIWNSSSLAYSLKLSWTVPETYNLPNSLRLFKILFFKDMSLKSVKVPAVRTIGLHRVDMLQSLVVLPHTVDCRGS